MEDHTLLGAVVGNHEAPESLETQMPPPFAAAIMLTPLVEQAMAAQLLLGALLNFQFVPVSSEL